MSHSQLFKRIEDLVPTLGGWATPLKCCEFAAIILATRCKASVELGTWEGRGGLSMALAHRFTGTGKCHVVDPWSAPASVDGQDGPNADWWGEQAKHDGAFDSFNRTLKSLDVDQWIDVQRAKSDDAVMPEQIGLLVVDGNHGPQAVVDVKRWAPRVSRSGFVYLDDLNWTGGAVAEAGKVLLEMGFTPLWARDEGMFYQRTTN